MSLKVIENTSIGNNTIVRDFVHLIGAKIGDNCRIGTFVEIQKGVTIGNDCKIQPFAFIPVGVTIGNRVFIGPHACFTNDKNPHATGDWDCLPTIVEDDASIGAGAVILPGIRIGKGAMVGAGAVVTKDVPAGATVYGNAARLRAEVLA